MKEGLLGLFLVGLATSGWAQNPEPNGFHYEDAINRARQFQVPAVKGVMLAAAQASPQRDEHLEELLTRLGDIHQRQQESYQDKVQVCQDIQYHIAEKVISEEIVPLQVQMDKLFAGLSAWDKARIHELIRTINSGKSVARSARSEAQIKMFALLSSRLVGQGDREWDSRSRLKSISRRSDDGMVISVWHYLDPNKPHKPAVKISMTRELGSRSSFGKDLFRHIIEVHSLSDSNYMISQGNDTDYVREQRVCGMEKGLDICRYGLVTYVNRAMPQDCRDILQRYSWGELDPGRLQRILETQMGRKIVTHWDYAWDFRKWYQVGNPF